MQAQMPRTSYFMDKYANRHQRNPALSPAWGYVNIPGAGGINVATESNLRLSDIFYPLDNGKLGLWLNENVDSDEALKNFKKSNHIGANVNVNVLGFGFYTLNHKFFSFDYNLKIEAGANLPKTFFEFPKRGMTDSTGTTYNLKNINVAARVHSEFAMGYAQDISEDLRVGGKFKFLIGHTDARLMVDQMNILMSRDVWTINTKATGTILGAGLITFEEDSAGIIKNFNTLDNVSLNSIFGGYGAAVDFGVVYKLDNFLDNLLPDFMLKGFTASFSLTDLGFIRYNKNNVAQAQSSEGEMIHTADSEIIKIGDNDGIKVDLDHLKDQFTDLIGLRETHTTKGMARGLRTTANLGLEYSFLEDKMSAGLLWSTHFGLPKTHNEITLSYNLRPCNWFSLTLSSSLAHGFFRSAGWAMNLTPKYGLNFFFGMDYVPFAYTAKFDMKIGEKDISFIGLPIHTSNLNFNFGMSVPIGGNRYHKYLKKPVALDVEE
jgi:hypothetical protein